MRAKLQSIAAHNAVYATLSSGAEQGVGTFQTLFEYRSTPSLEFPVLFHVRTQARSFFQSGVYRLACLVEGAGFTLKACKVKISPSVIRINLKTLPLHFDCLTDTVELEERISLQIHQICVVRVGSESLVIKGHGGRIVTLSASSDEGRRRAAGATSGERTRMGVASLWRHVDLLLGDVDLNRWTQKPPHLSPGFAGLHKPLLRPVDLGLRPFRLPR
jgi:hypothetical protein